MFVQVEISKTYGMQEWRDDLRKVLKMAGEANKKVGTAARFCYLAASCGTAFACFLPQGAAAHTCRREICLGLTRLKMYVSTGWQGRKILRTVHASLFVLHGRV
jgi:hypothetical protein